MERQIFFPPSTFFKMITLIEQIIVNVHFCFLKCFGYTFSIPDLFIIIIFNDVFFQKKKKNIIIIIITTLLFNEMEKKINFLDSNDAKLSNFFLTIGQKSNTIN